MSANNQETNQNEAGPQQQFEPAIPQTGNKWPMTGFFGDISFLDEDILYAQVLEVVMNGEAHGLLPLRQFIPQGTENEKDDIQDAILARMQQDPNFTASIWQHTTHEDSNAEDERKKTYPIQFTDGNFSNQTMDTIIGALITGSLTVLEVQGSVDDQRQFFAAVRQFIPTISVVQGKDVKEPGAVTFKEPWEYHALAATLDNLEAQFESLVLSSMEPAAEEADLADTLGNMGMDVENAGA